VSDSPSLPIDISLTKPEADALKRAAAQRGQELAAFIKTAVVEATRQSLTAPAPRRS
jgi:uncharacterized protein (DUF1778 family)